MWFLLPLLLLGADSNQYYSPLKGVSFQHRAEDTVDIKHSDKEYIINYRIYDQSTETYLFLDNQKLVNISIAVMNFALKENNASLNRCKRNYKLDFYLLESDTINDNSKFDYQVESKTASVAGLYDPVSSTAEKTYIFLSASANHKESTLAHELYHYWHDRLCFGDPSKQENYALKFEEFYRNGLSQ